MKQKEVEELIEENRLLYEAYLNLRDEFRRIIINYKGKEGFTR